MPQAEYAVRGRSGARSCPGHAALPVHPLRVKASGPRTGVGARGVMPGMKSIRDEHLAEPGLVVVDVAAADDATALAFQAALARCWATATDDRTTRDPGEPGVRLRCYLDLRQEVQSAFDPATGDTTALTEDS